MRAARREAARAAPGAVSVLLDLSAHLRAMEPTNARRRARARCSARTSRRSWAPTSRRSSRSRRASARCWSSSCPARTWIAIEVGRVPWEMLRIGGGDLLVHHLAPQIVHGTVALEDWQRPAPHKKTDPLRVLVVLANAIGDTALALRREASMLRGLYRGEIATKRKVEIDTDPVRGHARGGASRSAGQRVRRGAPVRPRRAGRVHPGARGGRRARIRLAGPS